LTTDSGKAKEPYISAKEPYMSTKEPYIPVKGPYEFPRYSLTYIDVRFSKLLSRSKR